MKHVVYTNDELEILTEVWNNGSVGIDHDASASKQQTECIIHHVSNGLVDMEYKPNVCLPYIISTWSNKR